MVRFVHPPVEPAYFGKSLISFETMSAFLRTSRGRWLLFLLVLAMVVGVGAFFAI
ncbi:MAG: hypothetical protein AAGF12_40645 [Myxococcota bacterium]